MTNSVGAKAKDSFEMMDTAWPLKEIFVLAIVDSHGVAQICKILADQGAAGVYFAQPAYEETMSSLVPNWKREGRPPSNAALAELLAKFSRRVDIVLDSDSCKEADGESYLTRRFSRLIHCSLVDFPREARTPSSEQADDRILLAELGLNRISTDNPELEPLDLPTSYGAIWASIYIAAALIHRDEQDGGQYIEMPRIAAALTALGRSHMRIHDARHQDPLLAPRLPIWEIYRCAEDTFVQNHGTYANFVEILCEALEHPEWSQDAVAGLRELPSLEDAVNWRKRLSGAFESRRAEEWEARISDEGGACIRCRTPEEWQNEEHARETEIITDSHSGRTGSATRVWRLSDHARRGARRSVDRERRDPFQGPWRPGSSEENSRPLEGLRVVDFCIVLAGPTCGRTLAELGADVIKVDDPHRPVHPHGWLEVNRGKRSALIDMRQAAGKAVVRELVSTCDVVLENFRAGKMTDLGFGFESVSLLRPGIVYASMNAFDYGGPWSTRPGWEHSAQAAVGMQDQRAVGGVPKPVSVPVNDFATGLLGALGVILGLRARDKTGESFRVTASLARTATYLIASARSHVFSTDTCTTRIGDEWIRIVDGLSSESTVESLLPRVQNCTDPGDAVRRLRAEGAQVALERKPGEILSEPWFVEAGLARRWTHQEIGEVTQVIAQGGASKFSIAEGWPAHDPGADTIPILENLGYSKSQIQTLLTAGSIYGPRSILSTYS